MKKTKTNALLLLTLLLGACQREAEDLGQTQQQQQQNPPGTTAPARLAAIFIRDSTQPSGRDTAFIRRFIYDAAGRVSEIISTDKLPGGDSTNLRLFYNGSDTLATRSVAYDRETFGTPSVTYVYYDTTYFVYANGRRVMDSSRRGSSNSTGPNVQTTKYVYNGNRVFHYLTPDSRYQTQPGNVVNGELHLVTKVNGNIVAQVDSTASYNLQTGAITATGFIGNFSATYDTHTDPVYALTRSFHIAYAPVEYFVEIPSDGFFNPMLPATTQHGNPVYSPTGLVRTENTYTFRPDGLPAKRKLKVTYTTTEEENLVYVYQ